MPAEVVDERRRVPGPRFLNLLVGVQKVVAVNAPMRVDEMDGHALIILGSFEHVVEKKHVEEAAALTEEISELVRLTGGTSR